MKALVCLSCVDIRALTEAGPVTCRCGQATAEWIDPLQGTMRAWGERDLTRVMGMHNGFLRGAATMADFDNHGWRELHKAVCTEGSKGYLFADTVRNCWVVLITPGQSRDTAWGKPEDRP